jgi:hypothetical protein
MNQFQKNVVFVGAAVLVIIAVCFGISFAMQVHSRNLQERARLQEEQKLAWKKDNVRALKALSGIGALSPEEQTLVDNAGDDVERLQQVLLDIHQERSTYWVGRLQDVADRRKKLEQLSMVAGYSYYGQVNETAQSISKDEEEDRNNLRGYQTAMAKIRDWRPSKFEDYHPAEPVKSDFVIPSDKPSASISMASNTQPLSLTPNGGSAVTPIPLPPVSSGSNTESSGETALDNVDVQISHALDHWAKAMESNDPTLEAQCYAEQVDRYFLKLNVTNIFVRDYMETWLKENDRRVVKFVPKDVTFENETATTAKLRLVKYVVTSDSSGTSERFTRSRLYLKKEYGDWKITSEQDFK